ncbi:hypothetical protein Leryth_014045 [Lithospermum erythrorhizon]|nr:hypothetical protein Leryth_014045 [Lithospermum erythrorhizon]
MITRRCKTLLSHSLKNRLIYNHLQNPQLSFLHSLLFSTKPQKTPKKSTITSDYFVQKYQFSYEIATKAASLLAHLKTPEKCDAVLSFFKEIGFSKMDLQNLVKNNSGRSILCADVVKTLKPKIKIFQDLSISHSDIAFIVCQNTWVLLDIGKNRIFTSLLVLKNILGSVDAVVKLLKTSAWFIKHDLKKNMLPNIQFLLSCGIHLDQLNNHIFNFPRLLLHKPDKLRKFVVNVDEMKFNRKSKLYLYAITCVASMNEVTWKEKLELVRSLGFTQDQIFQMFQRAPAAFAVSRWKIKDVVQVISGSGMYESIGYYLVLPSN